MTVVIFTVYLLCAAAGLGGQRKGCPHVCVYEYMCICGYT